MTTPQKSYRDLVEGETLKETDEYFFNEAWTPCHKYNIGSLYRLKNELLHGIQHYLHRRPIHRQPDGSWRDEGDEPKKVDLEGLALVLFSNDPGLDTGPHDFIDCARAACNFLGIPLEPEQEEWEKAWKAEHSKDEKWADGTLFQTAEENFKKGWQAHERKQGEKK